MKEHTHISTGGLFFSKGILSANPMVKLDTGPKDVARKKFCPNFIVNAETNVLSHF